MLSKRIRGEVMTLMFAGHDTTTSTVTFLFHEPPTIPSSTTPTSTSGWPSTRRCASTRRPGSGAPLDRALECNGVPVQTACR